MGKSMYDYINRTKERARQQKQLDKASKRLIAKQIKANINLSTLNEALDSLDKSESSKVEDNAKGTA